jgi:hypothetical protein
MMTVKISDKHRFFIFPSPLQQVNISSNGLVAESERLALS